MLDTNQHTRAHAHTDHLAREIVLFKALISLPGGASLHLHLVIIKSTSALYKLAVYIPIIHNAHTQT